MFHFTTRIYFSIKNSLGEHTWDFKFDHYNRIIITPGTMMDDFIYIINAGNW